MIACTFENGDKVGLRHAVVNVLIIKDGRLLLSKRGKFNGKPIPEYGKWSLIGGFVDRNETLVEAVKREAREESGWEIEDVIPFGINDNPQRPFDEERQNICIMFAAKASICKKTESEEVTELKWFDLDKLPEKDKMAFDHAKIIDFYKKNLKKGFSPIVFV